MSSVKRNILSYVQFIKAEIMVQREPATAGFSDFGFDPGDPLQAPKSDGDVSSLAPGLCQDLDHYIHHPGLCSTVETRCGLLGLGHPCHRPLHSNVRYSNARPSVRELYVKRYRYQRVVIAQTPGSHAKMRLCANSMHRDLHLTKMHHSVGSLLLLGCPSRSKSASKDILYESK